MTVSVPSQYKLYVTNAANTLGISPDIVAAQIQYESNWSTTAVSPAGAEGIAQFMPGTWKSYGSGSPFNAADAFAAYTKYMGVLLRQENGNIRNALAAYNAGPGNLKAGYGYADHILKVAGQGSDATASDASFNTSQAGWNPLSWPGGIVKFFDTISSGVFWIRVLMVISGGALLLYSLGEITGAVQAAQKAGTQAAKVAAFL